MGFVEVKDIHHLRKEDRREAALGGADKQHSRYGSALNIMDICLNSVNLQ
jgi:hypothetical protein